jgi:hypothetical protein
MQHKEYEYPETLLYARAYKGARDLRGMGQGMALPHWPGDILVP